jgi:glucose-1-phosphate cytidylyltransferase
MGDYGALPMPTSGPATIILCGGRGTRISEVNPLLPKPLLPVGDRPVLWHIMKLYASQGFADFVLALGSQGDEIKAFFLHYEAMTRDFAITLGKGDGIEYLTDHGEEGWRVACVDTGRDALTGTRVRRAAAHAADGPVMVTYGDSVGDVDIPALMAHHRRSGRLATVTAVRPPGRFGELIVDQADRVSEFSEKPQTSAGFINGGFMVFEREAIERYIPAEGDVMLEREPLAGLARDGQLNAFVHEGFWQPMDTPRERQSSRATLVHWHCSMEGLAGLTPRVDVPRPCG